MISGAIVGLVFHEWALAIVAYFGGDRTVAEKGYLTMDVRHYSNPLLTFGFPTLFLLAGGLPRPGGAVWINHHYLKSKWWDSAVSLAGPAINLLGAVVLYGIVESGLLRGHSVLAGASSSGTGPTPSSCGSASTNGSAGTASDWRRRGSPRRTRWLRRPARAPPSSCCVPRA